MGGRFTRIGMERCLAHTERHTYLQGPMSSNIVTISLACDLGRIQLVVLS